MTLQQLTYFLAAARHGSFSAGAESLHMAQPSLSEQVRRLEAELGVPLFVRAGKGLELTEAGQLLRPHAERTLAEAQEAIESVRQVREITGGTVAFGTFSSAHHYLTGGLVQDFRVRSPGVRIRVVGQNSCRSHRRRSTRTAGAGGRTDCAAIRGRGPRRPRRGA